MNHVQLPVFVRLQDCGDVVHYDSLAKIPSDFEQIDVENEEYQAWMRRERDSRCASKRQARGFESSPCRSLHLSN